MNLTEAYTDRATREAVSHLLGREVITTGEAIDLLTRVVDERPENKSTQMVDEDGMTGYDWNIYVGDYDRLSVTAYARAIQHGCTVTDTSNFLSYDIEMNLENNVAVSYLLRNPLWHTEGWLDHDEWVDEDFLTDKHAPGDVRYWVKQVNKMSEKEFKKLARKQQKEGNR